jgi:RNA polymerase sigma factor (sigma-70 family)
MYNGNVSSLFGEEKMENNNDDCRLLKSYLKKHNVNVKNPIIVGFLDNQDNRINLLNYIKNNTPENRTLVDEAFKRYYFKAKFTNYLSQTIYFNAINYDKRHRLNSKRNQLILDKPLGDSETETILNNVDPSIPPIELNINDSPRIEDHISDCNLYEAINKLTNNQKQILSLSYVYGYNDSEIAKILNKSQQAVSKSHKRSLEQLQMLIEERRVLNE